MPPRDRLIRVHVQNDPLSPNDAVTPPRFAKGATGFPELRRRLRVTFGVDPPALEAGLREAEILVVAHVDGRDLRARAPRLRWIQSTSAGVEKLVPHLPPDIVLTNASGVHIPKGDAVLTSYPSANRDEDVFDVPMRFDIRRPDADKMLSFGLGMHYCLGAQVARREVRTLLMKVLERTRSIELAGEPEWSATHFVSGVKHLPIRYELG